MTHTFAPTAVTNRFGKVVHRCTSCGIRVAYPKMRRKPCPGPAVAYGYPAPPAPSRWCRYRTYTLTLHDPHPLGPLAVFAQLNVTRTGQLFQSINVEAGNYAEASVTRYEATAWLAWARGMVATHGANLERHIAQPDTSREYAYRQNVARDPSLAPPATPPKVAAGEGVGS